MGGGSAMAAVERNKLERKVSANKSANKTATPNRCVGLLFFIVVRQRHAPEIKIPPLMHNTLAKTEVVKR